MDASIINLGCNIYEVQKVGRKNEEHDTFLCRERGEGKLRALCVDLFE